ncbi:MAG: NusA-like transcription termination signal-binding factor [Candidatus Thorarchaeota archaeon]
MPSFKLTMEDMALIATFERITGVSPIDVIRDDETDRVIFVVREKQLGRAVGKGGSNVRAASEALGKTVDIVEHADTAEEFVKRALAPARVERVRISQNASGALVATVSVKPEDRGIAIGKDGRNVERARRLAKRHFGLDSVMID